MSEHSSNVSVEMGSERNFGYVFATVFAVIGLWPLTGGNDVRIWALAAAAVLLSLALFAPAVLKWPNRAWFKFGMLLGAVVAPIVMFLVYISTFLTIGGLMRLFGKDPLDRKFDPDATSYWKERTDPPNSMKNQF
jgi:hypothetical protein